MLCWITDITGSIAELRKQVIMSVTKAVFRVCMTLKKVLENFAETTDFTLLLTMFFGSDLLVIFLKASQMQNYAEKGDSTLCALCQTWNILSCH